MDLVILEKIEHSILNGLGYIGLLEKKNGNKKIAYEQLEWINIKFESINSATIVNSSWFFVVL